MSTLNVFFRGRGEVLSPFSSYARKRMKRPFSPWFSSQRLFVQNTFFSALKTMTQARRAALVSVLCLAALGLGVLGPVARAQMGEWVWMSGSKSTSYYSQLGPPGVYGTKGAVSSTNVPGARQSPATWTDSSGNLWLFGGYGNGSTVAIGGDLNDLWEFDSSTKQWTWVSGSSTDSGNNDGSQYGVYGTKGTAASTNVPGARQGASSWTDSSGNLWLFGGRGYATSTGEVDLNDLWEFNPSTKQWTWVSGSNTGNSSGVYGTQGAANSANVPGSRDSAVSWIDSSGNFWLFGGTQTDVNGDAYNDLWKFDPTTSQWTWVSGSSSMDQSGTYGAQVGAVGTPGARFGSSSWIDSSDNLWLLGGCDNNWKLYNDLWRFDPSTSQWTWVSGNSDAASTGGVNGTYSSLGATGTPGSRYYASSWIDSSDNLWLFGGDGYDSNNSWVDLNDLWKFDFSTSEWTWIGGSNTGGQSGTYGTEGSAASGNVPGGRYGAGSWTGSNGYLWLFGGTGYDSTGNNSFLNDLWEYQFAEPTAAKPVFNVAGGTYTTYQTVTISDSTSGATIYYTTDGTKPTTSSSVYTSAITVTSSETIKAIAVASGYNNSFVASADYEIQISTVATPVINPNGGAYTTYPTVTITDSTPNAVIHYTTDGSTPTATSTVYTGPITVTSSETITAIAVAYSYYNSDVTSATFTLNLPTAATPVISPGTGTYTAYQYVTISDATSGATIYYTTDGTTPTTNSTKYTGQITVKSSETIQAIAVASEYWNSAIASATYTVNLLTPVLGSLSPAYISGGTAFTLTVNGTNFTALSTIYWNVGISSGLGTALTTTYVSPTQITAQITAAQTSIASGTTYATYAVSVVTPDADTSNTLKFVAVSPNYSSLPMTISPTTATVTTGSSATYAVAFTNATSGVVTCLNLPTGASYVYANNSNSTTAGTLTITTSSTTPTGTYLLTVVGGGTIPATTSSTSNVGKSSLAGIALPVLLLPLWFLRRRMKARGVWPTVCIGLLLLVSSSFLVSCAAGGPKVGLGAVSDTTSASNATTVTLIVQ